MPQSPQRQREIAAERRAFGLCQTKGCSNKAVGTDLCESHQLRKREYRRKLTAQKAEQGICSKCTMPCTSGNRRYCEKHLELDRTRRIRRELSRLDKGTCVRCGDLLATNSKRLCDKHLKEAQARQQSRRNLVFSHYGSSCACCGNDVEPFLTIDHVNNDGAEHRRQVKTTMYHWLIRNNFPEGFQTLCMNCNFAKRFTGKCPCQSYRKALSQVPTDN